MFSLFGMRTKSKAIGAARASLHQVRAPDSSHSSRVQAVVHIVLHSGDSAGKQSCGSLQSLRHDLESFPGVESTVASQGDGCGSLSPAAV